METLLPLLCICVFVIYDPPSWLSTIGSCMGTSATGTGISDSSAVSTKTGSTVMVWASAVVAGVANPMVTGVGGILGTCLC